MKPLDLYVILIGIHIRNKSQCSIAKKKNVTCEILLTYSESQLEHIRNWAEITYGLQTRIFSSSPA